MAFNKHLTLQQPWQFAGNLQIGRVDRCVRYQPVGVIAAILAVWLAAWQQPAQQAPAQLLYSQDFTEPSSMDEFVFSDASAWRLSRDKDQPFLELFQASRYQPPFRSPLSLALLTHFRLADFILECKCQQTSRDYAHRDLVFVFGYQGPDQFYYAHVAAKSDDHANGIFIVNRGPRRKLPGQTNQGNDWGRDVWRRIRLERRLSSGAIKLFFDDWNRPVMAAEDKTFGTGWVGVGSFDDTGRFALIRIYGSGAERSELPPFPVPSQPSRPPSR
jgi:hypothetical protein